MMTQENEKVRKQMQIVWVRDRYSDEIGRPSIDPVTLIKITLIQYLYGIKSMRQTIKEIEVNMAYRWFDPTEVQKSRMNGDYKWRNNVSFPPLYKRNQEGRKITPRNGNFSELLCLQSVLVILLVHFRCIFYFDAQNFSF